jgi:hypothetical protein
MPIHYRRSFGYERSDTNERLKCWRDPMGNLPAVIGRDGKHYPAAQLSADELEFLIAAVHRLSHDQRLSVRQIQRWLSENGVQRSLGSIAAYLAQPCGKCLR